MCKEGIIVFFGFIFAMVSPGLFIMSGTYLLRGELEISGWLLLWAFVFLGASFILIRYNINSAQRAFKIVIATSFLIGGGVLATSSLVSGFMKHLFSVQASIMILLLGIALVVLSFFLWPQNDQSDEANT